MRYISEIYIEERIMNKQRLDLIKHELQHKGVEKMRRKKSDKEKDKTEKDKKLPLKERIKRGYYPEIR